MPLTPRERTLHAALWIACGTAHAALLLSGPLGNGFPLSAPAPDTTRWSLSGGNLRVERNLSASRHHIPWPHFQAWILRSGSWAVLAQVPGTSTQRIGYADLNLEALAVTSATGPILSLLILYRRKRRRPPPGHCPRCGYDLRATPTQCPECGNHIPPHTRNSPGDAPSCPLSR